MKTITSRQIKIILVFGLTAVVVTPMPAWAQGTTKRVSVSSVGVQGNGYSIVPALSADGRFVAFYSAASTLVTGDANDADDAFIRDLKSGTTKLVSVNSSGVQGNRSSVFPVLSSDGRFVAFKSEAANLVTGDSNGVADMFIRDLKSGTTELVSVSSGGVQGNYGAQAPPAVSAGARFVAFASESTNLVAVDTNSFTYDVFIRDRQKGTTKLVSLSSAGVQGNGDSITPVLSPDGRFVAFRSRATNLIANDTNNGDDIFIRDRQKGTTELVSVSSAGDHGNGSSFDPSISADGRFVAFASTSYNLVPNDTTSGTDVYVRDRKTHTTKRVSVSSSGDKGSSYSVGPALSADGRFVAFYSAATNLVTGDTDGVTDVFIRDRQAGTTKLVSVNSGGVQGNGDSLVSTLSADGRFVAFESEATNLVTGDINGVRDVFVHGLAP